MQLRSIPLKKKKLYVAYHKCWEAVAVGFFAIGYIYGKQNMSDILTELLVPEYYYKILEGPLFVRNR